MENPIKMDEGVPLSDFFSVIFTFFNQWKTHFSETTQANSTEILGWLLCAAVLGPFLAGLAAIGFLAGPNCRKFLLRSGNFRKIMIYRKL